jgi:hypothetical protein
VAGQHGEIDCAQSEGHWARSRSAGSSRGQAIEPAQRIADAGFTEVEVTGDGREREVKARWPLDDATPEIPSQISKIVEIA